MIPFFTTPGFFLCLVLFLERYQKYLIEHSLFPNWEGFPSYLLRLVLTGKLNSINGKSSLKLHFKEK